VLSFLGGKGYLVSGSIRGSTDYSYAASQYAGDHYRIIGDAANFVDPFFASGVHIAMAGAMSAAITIQASMKGQVTEVEAQKWHAAKVGMSHTRFLFIVSGAYRQMKQQQRPLANDVNEDDFDRAFATFRPVIAGLSDISTEFTDEKIEKVMDFCAHFFEPAVGIENVISVRKRYDPVYSDLSGPILSQKEIEEIAPGDEEARKVIVKMNAIKVIREEGDYVAMEKQGLLGYVASTTRGHLGLQRITQEMVTENTADANYLYGIGSFSKIVWLCFGSAAVALLLGFSVKGFQRF